MFQAPPRINLLDQSIIYYRNSYHFGLDGRWNLYDEKESRQKAKEEVYAIS